MQNKPEQTPASGVKRKKLVVVGGGTAGWMAANLLAYQWRNSPIDIAVVESPDIATVGVGEGSTPTLKRFFSILGIPETQWMPACNATYKLNIRFKDWSPASGVKDYSHPFIGQVDTFHQRAFYTNCLTRRMGLDVNTQPDDFLLNGVLAAQGKGPQTPANFPFRMEYGYHFDSQQLGLFLKQTACDRGVEYIPTTVNGVSQHESGDIATLHCNDHPDIHGDFFIDCTGFAGFLMQKTLQVPFESYASNLFNDRAVVVQTPRDGKPLRPETTSTALSTGWCWHIPLTNRVGNGYVYSSGFIDDDSAEKEFRQHLGLGDDVDCRRLNMRVGQLEKHWHRNCLGLGLSQGFIEPLEATALHLVQISIEMFASLYSEANFSCDKRDEFNTRVRKRFDAVRDYIVAHYKLNTRNDTDYWRANRNNMQLSTSLLDILDTWYRCKDLGEEIRRQDLENHFGTTSWHCLLAGYGAFPELPPNQPGQGDLYKEQDIQAMLAGCALNFDSHEHNLDALRGVVAFEREAALSV